jgi:hypothetical protein
MIEAANPSSMQVEDDIILVRDDPSTVVQSIHFLASCMFA